MTLDVMENKTHKVKIMATDVEESAFKDMDEDVEINAYLEEKTIGVTDKKDNDALNEMNNKSDTEEESSAEDLIGEEYKNYSSNKDSLERDMLKEIEKTRH